MFPVLYFDWMLALYSVLAHVEREIHYDTVATQDVHWKPDFTGTRVKSDLQRVEKGLAVRRATIHREWAILYQLYLWISVHCACRN